MDPERWQRIRRILDEVGDLPAAERDAALRRACGPDVTLVEEIRTLFGPADRASALADGIVAAAVTDLVADPLDHQRLRCARSRFSSANPPGAR